MKNENLIQLAKLSHGLLTRDAEGVTDEQALVTLFDGGNHLNWVVAHLVAGRDNMLSVLGAEPVRAKEVNAAFDYGSTPPTSEEAWPLAQHVADYQATQERLLAALESATDEQLEQPYKDSTVGARLTFMLWHEAYHVGQATLYRRKAGLKSPIG